MAGIVLVTGTTLVPQVAMDYIESRGYQVRHAAKDTFSEHELDESLASVSGYLIGGYEEPSASNFEAAIKLQAVAWLGTDYKAYVPGWERAMELGIAIINSPGTNAVSVAEFTALLILSMVRPFTSQVVTPGKMVSDSAEAGRDLYHHRLGIIGLGRVGSRVAKIAKLGFEMDVVYSAPRRDEDLEHALGIEYVQKEVLLASSDIVTLHRPSLGPDESYEIGEYELSQIKNGAIIVNTVHPHLIDFAALADAIETKQIRAAMDGIGSGPAWDRLVALGPERFLALSSMAFNTVDANFRAEHAHRRGGMQCSRWRDFSRCQQPRFPPDAVSAWRSRWQCHLSCVSSSRAEASLALQRLTCSRRVDGMLRSGTRHIGVPRPTRHARCFCRTLVSAAAHKSRNGRKFLGTNFLISHMMIHPASRCCA